MTKSTMNLVPAAILGLCALGLGGCQPDVSDTDVLRSEIKLQDLQKLYAKRTETSLLLIDVELPQVYAEKHIAGAVNVPWTTFSEKKDDVDPRFAAYDDIVIYGRDRAQHGAVFAGGKRMIYSGYKISSFLGGLEEWERAGLPVESGATKPKVEDRRTKLK